MSAFKEYYEERIKANAAASEQYGRYYAEVKKMAAASLVNIDDVYKRIYNPDAIEARVRNYYTYSQPRWHGVFNMDLAEPAAPKEKALSDLEKAQAVIGEEYGEVCP